MKEEEEEGGIKREWNGALISRVGLPFDENISAF